MKSYLGLDIGLANIKLVEVTKEKGEVKVLRAGLSPTPARAFLSEAEADQEKLAESLKTLIADLGVKTRQANLSILESQVFTRVIETPKLSDKELAQSLRWEAEQYIPLPLEEVNMDFVVLEKPKEEEKMRVLLVAAPTRIIEKYTKLGQLANLEIKALESEGLALYRLFQDSEKNILLVNLGAETVSFYLFKKRVLILGRTSASGSNVFTKALVAELNLPQPQAEEYKKTYGLDPSQGEGKVFSVLKPLVESLLSDTSQALVFFKERFPEEVINQIVLTGGGSLLPGLASYFQEKLSIEVVLGNPWQKFTLEEKVKAQFAHLETFFSVASGMAVREILS